MSGVDNWDPASQTLGQSHRELLNEVATTVKDRTLHLERGQLDSLRALYLITAQTWLEFAADKTDEELFNWIKVLTLCPEQYPGFADGARSPVIPLVRVLRQRDAFTTTINRWIKEHTTNRFLPHGSLTDRLS